MLCSIKLANCFNFNLYVYIYIYITIVTTSTRHDQTLMRINEKFSISVKITNSYETYRIMRWIPRQSINFMRSFLKDQTQTAPTVHVSPAPLRNFGCTLRRPSIPALSSGRLLFKTLCRSFRGKRGWADIGPRIIHVDATAPSFDVDDIKDNPRESD